MKQSRSGPSVSRAVRVSKQRELTLCPEGWATLEEVQRRLGVGRSAVVRRVLALGVERIVGLLEEEKKAP
jgi:hypothetical protein